MKQVVLVNGVPASGKTTLAASLVGHLTANGVAAVPLSLDVIKECLYTHVGTGDRDYNRMLGRASYHGIFASISAFPDTLVPVIDAWHGFVPREVLQEHLETAGVERVIEVWCDVAPTLAADRYRARAHLRSAGHPPASYADELFDLARRAGPLELGPTIRIDTAQPIEEEDLNSVLTYLGVTRG